MLQQVGAPDDVYRQPVNRFVATFIGSPAMNVLPVTMNNERLHAGPFTFKPPRGAEALNGKKLELGIRPEDLQVFTEGSGPGAPAIVQVVEAAGNETFLHLDATGHPLIARTGSTVRPAVGTTVRLDIPRRKAYLFDAESGKTLVQQE